MRHDSARTPFLAPAEAPGAAADRGRTREGLLLDALICGAVLLYSLPILPASAASRGHGIVLLLASLLLSALPLLRRRHPLAVVGAMLLVATGHALVGAPLLVPDVLILMALHTAASRRPPRLSVPAAAAVIAWLLLVTLPRPEQTFLDVGELGVLVLLVVWVWTWGALSRSRRARTSALQERAEHAEREREALARAAVAEERARIAREFHDVVSHSLSVMVVMADGAAHTLDGDPQRARSAILTVRDTGRSALQDMRGMLGVLREGGGATGAEVGGSPAPQPGIADLEPLIAAAREAGMPVRLECSGDLDDLPASVALTAYRIVQEALTNVRKHAADARHVDVQVGRAGRDLTVRVRDDGTAAAPGLPSGGHGTTGMRERVAAHGGTLRIGPRDGGGYEVRAEIPTGQDA